MSPAPRIAVDARPLAFPDSGIGRYTASLLREFAQQQNSPRLFLYCDRPISPAFPLPAHWTLRCGNVHRRALSTPFAQVMFPRWAQQDRIDTFWSPRHHLPLFLPKAIHKVVTVHDLVWKRFPETMTGGGRLIESLLMPASLRLADRVIAVSHFTRQEIVDLFPASAAKTSVIYEASSLLNNTQLNNRQLNSVHEPTTQSATTPYFLFVGSNEPRKNLPRLLDAYRQYRQQVKSPANLVLVGSYQWGGFDLADYIARHELQPWVQRRRNVDDETLCGLYADAMALLMPSLYEGFGLPLVEAMQWGVPIITSHSSAAAEIAGDSALLVDPLRTDSISNALQQLSADPALRAQLASRSAHRSQQFSWRSAAIQTLQVLVE